MGAYPDLHLTKPRSPRLCAPDTRKEEIIPP